MAIVIVGLDVLKSMNALSTTWRLISNIYQVCNKLYLVKEINDRDVNMLH